MANVIEVQSVQKKFGYKNALESVTFSVKKGEIFGFLGPSGSGKTTMIKILTGQLYHDQGKVEVFEKSVKKMAKNDNRKRFGILTDNSGLYVRLSIEENLLLYCDLYGVPKTAIKEALEFVKLYEDRKKRVAILSKGMTQRVLLARAILHKPSLLFLDEPTSALDPASTAHIHNGLRQLNKMGTTIFLTTHDMQEAESLCDRVAFLDKGEVRAIGTPSELKQQYSEKTITVELTDGTSQVIENQSSQAKKLYEWMEKEQILRIHTNEPNLGDIFMQITGSDLR